MKKKIINVVLIFVSSVSAAFSQNQITNSIISSGGTTVSNASYNFNSTIGESFIGKSVNAANQQQTGFWYIYQQTIVTDVEDEETIPTVFKLEQNYPNPFNPTTIIRFGVPERSNVMLKIYDILGSEVATLVNEEMDAGWYERSFNAVSLSSGVYIYRLEAVSTAEQSEKFISIKKMLLIK